MYVTDLTLSCEYTELSDTIQSVIVIVRIHIMKDWMFC